MYPQRIEALLDQPISFLERSGLGTRAQNALERAGYSKVYHVLNETFESLCNVTGYDVATHKQLLKALQVEGIYRKVHLKNVQTYALKEPKKMFDVFDNEKFKDSASRVMTSIQGVEGSVKIGMTVEGQVHPQSLISVLMGIKEQQIHCSQQVAILSSLVKAILACTSISEDQMENIVDDFSTDIDAKITHLEEMRKKNDSKESKSKIVLPQGPAGGLR